MNLKVGKKRDNSSVYPVFQCEFLFDEENTLERWQNMPPPNMTLWHEDNFELRALEKS